MVYCGKASQGCQNCRTRRIKCDRVKPECSQCLRVAKKCPGYRDQLSLMFRDESTKVMQRAHAQWGVGDADFPSTPLHVHPYQISSSSTPLSVGSASSAALPLSSISSTLSTSPSFTPWAASPFSHVNHHSTPISPPSPAPSNPPSVTSSKTIRTTPLPPRLYTPIDPNLEEQGFQFYVNRYLVGHPDEPRNANDLSSASEWLWSPSLRDIITAIGLASLSNLRGDKDLMLAARRRYGAALRQTGQLVMTRTMPSFEVTMRAIVKLAMFELVRGTNQNLEQVNSHVLGAIALLRAWCPMPNTPFSGVRGLVQLCYCMFIPAHLAAVPLAPSFFGWVTFSRSLLDPVDAPSSELGLLIAEFVKISSYIQTHILYDGQSHAASALQQLIQIDKALAAWEAELPDVWQYRTVNAPHLPPTAIFRGQYHIYYDMWFARMWAHYRWARILANQTILEFLDAHPKSGYSLVTAAERTGHFKTMQNYARDMLVSTPSHWRHPLLDETTLVPVVKPGGAGSGAAGIPVLLFQIKVAGCAPGLPREYFDWVYGVIETIWCDLGMLHAKTMMESMVAHRDATMKAKEKANHLNEASVPGVSELSPP